jgi:hypothetical protein
MDPAKMHLLLRQHLRRRTRNASGGPHVQVSPASFASLRIRPLDVLRESGGVNAGPKKSAAGIRRDLCKPEGTQRGSLKNALGGLWLVNAV